MMKATEKGIKVYEQWSHAYVRDHDGVVLWKSSDRSPFADVLGDFLAFGYISQLSYDNTIVAKQEQDMLAVEAYLNRKPSGEQLFERNANRYQRMIMNTSSHFRESIVVDISGEQGSDQNLIALATSFAKPDHEDIVRDMKSGDYEHLVNVFDDHFGHFITLIA